MKRQQTQLFKLIMQSDDPMLVVNKTQDWQKYEIQIANPNFEQFFDSTLVENRDKLLLETPIFNFEN